MYLIYFLIGIMNRAKCRGYFPIRKEIIGITHTFKVCLGIAREGIILKKGKRIGIVAKHVGLSWLVAALFLGGCGSSKGSANSAASADTSAAAEESGYVTDDIYETAAAPAEVEEAAGGSGQVASNRKLIRTVHMSVETEEFDTLVAKLEQRVADLGGYMENMSVYNGSWRNGQKRRDASMTVRIPKEKLDMFVGEVSGLSNVVSKSEDTEDVTLSYVDLESRKKALTVEQDRLLELLGQAVSMEDIITIEERLSQVRYELESMESQLRTYDNLVDFSTVYLSVEEVEVLTPVEEISDFTRMVQGFGHSVGNLLTGIKEFLIGLVVNLPYLIFMAVLVFLAALPVRAVFRKGRKRREEWLSDTYGVYTGAGTEGQDAGQPDGRRTADGIDSGRDDGTDGGRNGGTGAGTDSGRNGGTGAGTNGGTGDSKKDGRNGRNEERQQEPSEEPAKQGIFSRTGKGR